MDLAHELPSINFIGVSAIVSILVLMDLAHEFIVIPKAQTLEACFNPCFNGSCSRMWYYTFVSREAVSFNPCFNGSCSRIYLFPSLLYANSLVSILVLMDLAHEWSRQCLMLLSLSGFNPCFNGSCSRILTWLSPDAGNFGFNPCFNGSCSRITTSRFLPSEEWEFQSLF